MGAFGNDMKNAKEDVTYFNMLNKICSVFTRLNTMTMKHGIKRKTIQDELLKTLEAYGILVGIDIKFMIEDYLRITADISKNKDEAAKQPKKINTKYVKGDCVVCPDCGKRIMRLREDTYFSNLVVYCKRCKKEYVISNML